MLKKRTISDKKAKRIKYRPRAPTKQDIFEQIISFKINRNSAVNTLIDMLYEQIRMIRRRTN